MAAKNMLDENYAHEEPEEKDDETPESPEGETPETPAAATGETPVAKTPVTRRDTSAERTRRILAELKETREALAKRDETQAEIFARLERDNAELRGHIQGIASRPVESRREEKAPDLDSLLAEANAALDAKDFTGYQKKYAKYNLELAAQDPRFSRQAPQPQGPNINPALSGMAYGQYPDVTNNQAALRIAQAHDEILAAQGIPNTPDRWKRAFDEGRRYLGKDAARPATFSTKSRDVLAGVPTARGGATASGGGEPGVVLSPVERATAKRFKMSEAEYAKELAAMHPERVSSE